MEICDHTWRDEEGRKGDSIGFIHNGSSPKERDRWMERIVGPRHARMLIFLERATISSTVLKKGYVSAGGELRGKKWVGLKPLFLAPTNVHLCKDMTHGHMKKGLIAEGASS
jgi:hypothetical protein